LKLVQDKAGIGRSQRLCDVNLKIRPRYTICGKSS
jgi:hypothetical protein